MLLRFLFLFFLVVGGYKHFYGFVIADLFFPFYFFFTWGVKCGFGCTYSGPQVISPLLSNCTLSLMISVDSRVQATIMLTAS